MSTTTIGVGCELCLKEQNISVYHSGSITCIFKNYTHRSLLLLNMLSSHSARVTNAAVYLVGIKDMVVQSSTHVAILWGVRVNHIKPRTFWPAPKGCQLLTCCGLVSQVPKAEERAGNPLWTMRTPEEGAEAWQREFGHLDEPLGSGSSTEGANGPREQEPGSKPTFV